MDSEPRTNYLLLSDSRQRLKRLRPRRLSLTSRWGGGARKFASLHPPPAMQSIVTRLTRGSMLLRVGTDPV